jgi:hypothetical protein
MARARRMFRLMKGITTLNSIHKIKNMKGLFNSELIVMIVQKIFLFLFFLFDNYRALT